MRASRFFLPAILTAALLAADAGAEPRASLDLEFMTIRRLTTGEGGGRESLFTVGGGVGFRSGMFVPYVGGGLGFFTAQIRAGVAAYPMGLYDSGLMLRLEARPQFVVMQCWQPGVTGQLGVGYHWPLEYRREGEDDPGAGFYMLPAFEAGPAWVKHDCGTTTETGYQRSFLVGGTIAAGFDW